MERDWNLIIEAGAWGVSIFLLIFACFKSWRKASVGFLFMQLLTWPFGLFAVEYGALEYPVRLFPKIINTSFTYEFMVLPTIGAIYCINFPANRRMIVKALYFIVFPSLLTIGEIIIVKYTDLIHYIHWNWFLSWLTTAITFHLNYLYFKWFFKNCFY